VGDPCIGDAGRDERPVRGPVDERYSTTSGRTGRARQKARTSALAALPSRRTFLRATDLIPMSISVIRGL